MPGGSLAGGSSFWEVFTQMPRLQAGHLRRGCAIVLPIMQDQQAAKQIAKWIALGALFLIPFAPLVVANTYFFPFITGKAFYLRILIEIVVCAWAVLAFLDKEYRPRFSLIGGAVIGFVAWMFVADAFAINAAKAFWSNFERMEGWVLLIHLLGFFFASSAVLRAGKKWRAWFLTSLGVSIIISVYALMQIGGSLQIHQGSVRIDATLGNSAYLAIYFLFSIFIALWLALTEDRSWLKWLLIVLAVSEGILLFFTETRGTVIGLVVALALMLILLGSFYLARDSSFVQGNHVLQRIASISLSDGQTRFTIWRMASKGVMDRPLTGYGQEGFNYIFNKYYDPSLYHQEPWFDRAHNAFMDWLVAGGIPAFLLYLSLFGSALILLWKSSELSRPERIALTGALVGYAIHNIFVFDNLYSYIYFFALLALIDSQVARPIQYIDTAPVLSGEDGITYVLPIATVVACALIWFVNVPGQQVANKLILALTPSPKGIDGNIAVFEDLVARPSFAAQEVREQLVSFAGSIVQNPQATTEQKQKVVALAGREMQKQVDAYPLDAREHLQLSYIYRMIGDGAGALKEIQAASDLSPRKESMFIEKGTLEWDMGNVKAAQASFVAAYALAPEIQDLAAYAATGYFVAGDTVAADAILQKTYGTTLVDSDLLAVAYYRTKNWPRLIALWKMRATAPDASVDSWFSLAAAYYMSGDASSAIETINRAVALHPSAATSAAAAIKQIRGEK